MPLLSIFRKKSDENLPDINVRDASSGNPIPIACNTGWDNDLIQVQSVINSPLEFIDLGFLSVGFETGFKNSKRKQYALLSCNFSDSGATATVSAMYRDKNNITVLGYAHTFVNILSGMSRIGVFDVFGASGMKFRLDSLSSGSVSLKVAFV